MQLFLLLLLLGLQLLFFCEKNVFLVGFTLHAKMYYETTMRAVQFYNIFITVIFMLNKYDIKILLEMQIG